MIGTLSSARTLAWLALAGAFLSIALMAARGMSVFSLIEPIQVITSGDEPVSHFAIWKFLNGQPIYHNRFEIPFDAVVFNWLFYYAYGIFTGAVQGATGLADSWIPTISRLFTLLAMAWGVAAGYRAFSATQEDGDRDFRLLCLGYGILVMAGPVMGFWGLTTRPDIWALALEITAVAAFLHLYPRSPVASAVAVALICYMAWGFKQINVFALGATGLVLLIERRWTALLTLTVMSVGFWLATFALATPQYLTNVFFGDYLFYYDPARMMRNIANFTVKSGPVLLPLAYIALRFARDAAFRRTLWRHPAGRLALAGIAVDAVLVLPASSQTGASENYYFTMLFFMALLVVTGFGVLSKDEPRFAARARAAGGLGWGSVMVAVALVFAGVTGTIDISDQHRSNMVIKRCLDSLPRPVYVNRPIFGLPWITPGNTPFVVSYSYQRERALGDAFEFERGGIAGLIEERYFAAIVLMSPLQTEVDGVPLKGYVRAPNVCPKGGVFVRGQDEQQENP